MYLHKRGVCVVALLVVRKSVFGSALGVVIALLSLVLSFGRLLSGALLVSVLSLVIKNICVDRWSMDLARRNPLSLKTLARDVPLLKRRHLYSWQPVVPGSLCLVPRSVSGSAVLLVE